MGVGSPLYRGNHPTNQGRKLSTDTAFDALRKNVDATPGEAFFSGAHTRSPIFFFGGAAAARTRSRRGTVRGSVRLGDERLDEADDRVGFDVEPSTIGQNRPGRFEATDGRRNGDRG